MEIIGKAIELVTNNKEFGALVGILIYSVKTHNSQKVQQATCNGKFEKQELKIGYVEEKAETAEQTANKAFRCVKQINKKVDGLIETVDEAKQEFQEKYKQYTDGKHEETLTKPNK